MLEPADIWRLANAGLAFIATALLVYGALADWKRLSPQDRLWVQALVALLLVVATASLESMIAAHPMGIRVLGSTIACCAILSAIALSLRGEK